MEHLSTKQILQVLDGVIEPSEQEFIKKHLTACALCRKEVELQQAIAWSMRSQRLTEPSAMFTDQVMAQVAPQRKAHPLRMQWAGAIAVCIIVVVGYLFIANTNNTVLSNAPLPQGQTFASPFFNSMIFFGDVLT